MRTTLITTGLFALLLAATSQPGHARDRDAGLRNDAALEASAARKKKKRRPQYVYVRRAPTAYLRRPWMDPSFGPDGRPYPNPYPPNVCSEDLGYGRFVPCNNRF